MGCASPAGDGLIAVAAAGLVTAPGLVIAPGLVATPGAGLSVTGMDAPGAAGCWPGGTFVAGDCMGAAGFAAAGFAGAWAPGAVGGFCAGGGDCATDVNTSASKQTEAMNGVFIILLNQQFNATIAVQECLYRKITTGASSKTFHFFAPRECSLLPISPEAGCKASLSHYNRCAASIGCAMTIARDRNAVLQTRPIIDSCLQFVSRMNGTDTGGRSS